MTPSPHALHADQPLATAGPPVGDAAAVLIMLHGRGGTAENMLGLYHALNAPGVAALAPQAAGSAWYPQSFLAPREANQPYLDSALRRIKGLIDDLMDSGISSDHIALIGFSQGACLTCEFVARNPRRYGAVMALTGGLIGAEIVDGEFKGSLGGTPVFMGTSDPDPHVPVSRVKETRDVFVRMEAAVDFSRVPGNAAHRKRR